MAGGYVSEAKAIAKVTLDGKEAGIQLNNLEKSAKELQGTLIDLYKAPVLDTKKIKETEIALNGVEKEMKQIKDASVSYQRVLNNLSGASLKELEQASRKLSAEVKTLSRNTDEYKQKSGDLSRIKTEMAKVRQEMSAAGIQTKTFGDRLREIGSNIFAATGIIGGFTALVTVVKNAFNTIKEFATGISQLKAITGASGKDLDYLKEKAIDLASEYGKSAREIVNAMKMVGSAKPELLENVKALSKVTEAVLTLSKASSMDLATSTSSLTTIMNQFGHGAQAANEDINILAAGSKYGAVEVDYLSDAISKVGTVASSAGLSLEQTTAAMELFGEKGVKAEIAGTGFKSVLVKLQADTKNYTNGVFDLNKAIDNNRSISNDNIALQNKFGKEFFNLAQILIQGKDRFNQLTEQVTNTNTAFEQASIATDNWQGDLDKAGGAWDKFILEIESGNGVISKTLRNVTQVFTGLLEIMANLNKGESLSLQRERQLQDVKGTSTLWTQSEIGKLKGIEDETKRKQTADKIIAAYEKQINDYDIRIGIMQKEISKVESEKKVGWGNMSNYLDNQINTLKIKNEINKKVLDNIQQYGSQLSSNTGTSNSSGDKPSTEQDDKERQKHYDKIIEDTKTLNDQIKQLGLELINDEQDRKQAELKLWYEKEQEKINISTASAEKRNEALLLLEQVYYEKISEIYQKNFDDYATKQTQSDDDLEKSLEKQLEINTQFSEENAQVQTDAQAEKSKENIKIQESETDKWKREWEKKTKKVSEGLQNSQTIIGNFYDFMSSAREAELLAAGDNEEKKKQIMKKYADKEFALKIAQIIASTAQAIMAAFAQLGPIGGGIAAGVLGATSLAQIASANRQREEMKGLAAGGLIPVTREQDGRYFDAEFGGNRFGYHTKPTVLVAEEGPEFVVSNRALQVPAFQRAVAAIDSFQKGISTRQLNYAGLFSKFGTVKGFADGGIITNNTTTNNTSEMAGVDVIVSAINNLSDRIGDMEVYVLISKINDAQARLNSIEAEVRL